MPAPSMALFAASRGMQAGQGIAGAVKQQLFAQLQRGLTQLRMSEISTRADVRVRNTFDAAKKVEAAQKSAIIKSGVTMESSSMEAISDTLSNAAEAALIARAEADFDLIQLGMEEAVLARKASDSELFTNIASSLAGAGVGYEQDKAFSGRATVSPTARGIGE